MFLNRKVLLGLAAIHFGLAVGIGFWNGVSQIRVGPEGFSQHSAALLAANLTALLAACCLSLQLLVISRAVWIERAFGFDRLTKFHAANAWAILALIVSHPLFVIGAHAHQFERSFSGQFLDFYRKWPQIPEAVAGLGLFLLVFVMTAVRLRRRIRYEAWYLTHLGAYPAVFLALRHPLEVGIDLAATPFLKFYFIAVYGFAAANLVIFRWILPVWFSIRHPLTVERVVRENGDVTSVYFRPEFFWKFRYRAGQFMIFRFLSREFWAEAHPFSLSDAPGKGCLRITCKKLGDFTARIPELKAGTRVLAEGPFGIFTADRARREKVLLIAGGIGITPLRALAETFVGSGRPTSLLYANRSEKDIVFRNELEALGTPGEFKVHHVIDDKAWEGERGRIDREKIVRLVPDYGERDIYVCGPPGMMKTLLRTLRELRVPGDRIHHEMFAL
jgi:predicted ferric reductase